MDLVPAAGAAEAVWRRGTRWTVLMICGMLLGAMLLTMGSATPGASTCTTPPLVHAGCKLSSYGGTNRVMYGSWTLCSEYLSERSHILSIGIGGDISFDIAAVKRHGARVACFDPTITAGRFEALIKPYNLSVAQRALVKFYPFGMAAGDDVLAFYRHNNPAFGSMVSTPGVPHYRIEPWVRAPVLRVQTMQFITQVPQIDLLKMDIEGAEWFIFTKKNKSLRDWLRCNPPQQIAIEFHDRFFKTFKKYNWISRKSVLELLKRCGYSQRHQNARTKEEVLFVRDHLPSTNC